MLFLYKYFFINYVFFSKVKSEKQKKSVKKLGNM